MKFAKALKECMKGARITRRDWNGQGMFVYYTPGSDVRIEDWKDGSTLTAEDVLNAYIKVAGHFDMRNAQGIRIIGWVPTQTDMTSDQWEIYGE